MIKMKQITEQDRLDEINLALGEFQRKRGIYLKEGLDEQPNGTFRPVTRVFEAVEVPDEPAIPSPIVVPASTPASPTVGGKGAKKKVK